MAPPLFSDLGKATRDVLDKNYVLDVFKVTAKNGSCGGLNLKTGVVHKFEDGSVKGDVDGTFVYPNLGLTVTKSWNTENKIGLSTECADKIYQGVTIKAEGSFNPDSGVKSGLTTLFYKHDLLRLHASFSASDESNSALEASGVVGYEGWLTGTKVEFDNGEGAVKNHYVALGHSYGPLQAFIISQNLELFTCNIYQRISNRCEMGLSFGVDNGEEQKKFYTLGARYLLDEDTSLRAKVDNESMVGFSLESTLGGCVKLIFSTLLDGKALTGGGHRFGVGVEIGG